MLTTIPETLPMTEQKYIEKVRKRNGDLQDINPNKVIERLEKLKTDVESFLQKELHVSVWKIAQKTIARIYDNISTSELDEVAAEVSAYTVDHPDYLLFSGNILMSNLEANNRDFQSFSNYVEKAYQYIEPRTGENAPLISKELYELGKKYGHLIDRKIDMKRNDLFDYFGAKSLIKGQYLLSAVDEKGQRHTFETPQHMYMRVSLGIYGKDLQNAFRLYDLMSQHYFTLASPTLFNAGTPRPQMSSCFLLPVKDDSIEGIYDTLKDCAIISKNAGGIGINIHDVRSNGSYIKGTNGTSNGIVPMLRVYNNTARYVDQGGGKRKGSFAVYLEPWHADIFGFLDLKKQAGVEELRCRDLFLGLWVPDLFMKRLIKECDGSNEEEDEPVMWSLMDPNVCPGLADVWGDEFEELYEAYELKGMYTVQVPIRKLFDSIATAMIETGVPYIMFKDHINRKSNQKNLGTIRAGNLCTEIVEYSSPDETAVCNLGSMSLPKFVNVEEQTFDFQGLFEKTVALNQTLNKVIDKNYYPLESARRSNMRHRPTGIGIQGLAKVFTLLNMRYGDEASKELNLKIMETMSFAAWYSSHQLTQEIGEDGEKVGPYPSMHENGGAPISHGIFPHEMWKEDCARVGEPDRWRPNPELNWDWEKLRADILRDGVRNSHVLAPMPTAGTSQLLGNPESFQPYMSNLYIRKTKNGEFICTTDLSSKLYDLGLWKTEFNSRTNEHYIVMKEKLKASKGNIQDFDEIPEDIKYVYVGIQNIKLKDLTIMARDRSIWVDQSSSLNVFFESKEEMKPKLLKYLCYAHRLGLKTASYYTRTIQDIQALDFSGERADLDKSHHIKIRREEQEEDDGICIPCGS